MVENMERQTKDWSQMTNELAKTWVETGNKMWQGWFEAMGMGTTRNLVENMQPNWEYFTQRWAKNQALLAELLQLSFDTWQELLPKLDKLEKNGNWQEALANYNRQVQQQLQEFLVGNNQASQDIAELWQLYLKEMQKFNQLWVESFSASLGPLSKAVAGTPQPWLELNELYWNLLYEETFGSLMQSPILGPSREFNGKLLRAFDAWTDLYRASADYQVVLADVQLRSFEELMKELVSKAKNGDKTQDWRRFQQIWSEVADRVFEEAFCNEENLKIRGKFLNSLNAYRLHQQDLMELWMKMMNVPVRSEIDEIHKNVYELRKEVKRLQKALAKYESQENQGTMNPES